jgi:type I restriction enzyme M protein
LVYYTSDLQEEGILDKAIIIDFEKYRNYTDWENMALWHEDAYRRG